MQAEPSSRSSPPCPSSPVLSRIDAYVDSTTVVEAEDAQEAALVHEGSGFTWEERGVVEFDARRIVTLDAQGEEIESTARGDL